MKRELIKSGRKQTKKAKRSAGNPAITKFSSNAFRRGEEIKTVDYNFTGAYNAAYTADTQPQQRLNFNTNTASVQCVSLIQQGAGISQRIGNKVSLKSLRCRFMITPTGGPGLNQTQGRFMVIYDRNPNGAYTAISSILGNSLQNNTIGAGTSFDNLNPNFFDRFVVLADQQLVLPPLEATITSTDYTASTSHQDFVVDRHVKLNNLECIFNGTANPLTVANCQTGALFIATFGNAAPASDPFCLIGTARLRFRDN